VVATSRLRHRLVPDLEVEGGHIGYSVRPSLRRRGYGALLLSLTLEKAAGLGMASALVTCDADNVASRRVIEKNGGVFAGEGVSPESGKTVLRYWVPTDRVVSLAQRYRPSSA
jgi:predicted acetyltransferase